MKKDASRSIRINSTILEALAEEGHTPQSMLDDRIRQLIQIDTTVRLKLLQPKTKEKKSG